MDDGLDQREDHGCEEEHAVRGERSEGEVAIEDNQWDIAQGDDQGRENTCVLRGGRGEGERERSDEK